MYMLLLLLLLLLLLGMMLLMMTLMVLSFRILTQAEATLPTPQRTTR